MLDITNHQGNTNQNCNKISPHTCKNGYYQQQQQQQQQQNSKCWQERGEKGALCTAGVCVC